ncbi:unnamed protein product [Adineta steineri]|uniref:Uncharacterized protein n=1 Tax=Adineta steineri TaxID=433720 RepID=A0A815JN40_9BILA|nr:unnamed protein product [Adineta steineri]CAF3861893.1 unnamed protein product [Adineta steineri]
MMNCYLNLQESVSIMNNNMLQFDCLYYYSRKEAVTYQGLADVTEELIPYCFRPTDGSNMSYGNFIETNGKLLSFEDLYLGNITAQQLLSWSASIDLAERYQFYSIELNSSLNEYFYNCTRPWFGSQCQYSFYPSENTFIAQIVESQFSRRLGYPETSDTVAQLPCYIHLHCDRGESSLCLDWREVCNEHVDCLGGEDEAQCYKMELNECAENQFRCHNGLCIPDDLWKNGLGNTDCLDRSDEIFKNDINSCFQDPSFRCEEHMCRSNWRQFTCGDGQCVGKFARCENGRHTSLIESTFAKGNLSEKCWIALTCFTTLVRQINNISCETLRLNNSLLESLDDCTEIFQFPINSIHFGHISFVYVRSRLEQKISTDMIPDYVCYDKQLCDFLTPTFSYQNLTCLHSNEIFEEITYMINSWTNIIIWIDEFFRGCSITHHTGDNSNHSSLYSCQSSSKRISKHRILDQIYDCYLRDDENSAMSCTLGDKYRIDCLDGKNCLSPLLSKDKCPLTGNEDQEIIPFEEICNRIPSNSDINNEVYIDGTDCSSWPCDNMYSRCDNVRTCFNGRDEANCDQRWCSSDTFACISPINYTLLCLPVTRINDNDTDCFGSSDEPMFCLERYQSKMDSVRFRCSNNSRICLPLSKLCDGTTDCDAGNDDEKFCTGHRITCDEKLIGNRSIVKDFLCHTNEKIRRRFFSVGTSINYPSLESSVQDKFDDSPNESYVTLDDTQLWGDNYPWPWVCNRGLFVRVAFNNSNIDNRCLCPPSYYGDLCQYQNQRVSITLRSTAMNRYASYALVLVLIDDDDEEEQIESYDQSVYIVKHSCSLKLNRYLLYSTRPKNTLKNYSVRLHVFEKTKMIYIGSWHFTINFLFLPVNRLVASVSIPDIKGPISGNCEKDCKNGKCVQYLNKKRSFCWCSQGWSGKYCHIRMNCESCSKDSICIGTSNNRVICVCPLTKFGPRCFLKVSCPLDACLNGGQCVSDVSSTRSNYRCLCSEQFFGSRCENMRSRLDVSLNKIDSPPYIVAYFISTSNKSNPTTSIILEKVTLFQRIITFHMSVPYNLVVVKVKEKFYLVVIQQSPQKKISTIIHPNRECFPIESLFNSDMMTMSHSRRVRFYHNLCQNNSNLQCFIDEIYLCLCTRERHANCMDFDRHKNLACVEKIECENGIECLEDHPSCPSTRICVCQDCFFGDRCQFYAKGFGITLDEILGYEIKRNINILSQPLSVQVSGIVTMIMFVVGVVNACLAIFVFIDKKAREVGCGYYLLASSVTSLIIVILFTIKFWILFLSRVDRSNHRSLAIASGFAIEIPLKVFLFMDNWLSACVAIERVYTVVKRMSFNKKKSRKVAKYVICCLPIIIVALMIPQLINLVEFDDEKEDRTWCLMRYRVWLRIYNLTLISFHFCVPLLINLLSSVFIIITTARQRSATLTNNQCFQHLFNKLKQYKHLLLSPLMLVALSSLHVGITFSMDCKKSSYRFRLHLIGYFLSFIPSTLVFIIFILPSRTYRKTFKDALIRFRRRFSFYRPTVEKLVAIKAAIENT